MRVTDEIKAAIIRYIDRKDIQGLWGYLNAVLEDAGQDTRKSRDRELMDAIGILQVRMEFADVIPLHSDAPYESPKLEKWTRIDDVLSIFT